MNRGIWYGIGAYAAWGLFPLYFKLTSAVPAMEVLSHRVIWSFLALAMAALAARSLHSLRVSGRVFALYAAAATLIGVNWFVYVWAVAAGFVVETSLGYFITPFVNVLLGVLVFGERLRGGQWVAVALAAAGVGYLAVTIYGALPWISIVLALSFGTYGLVKKKVLLPPLQGLTLETGILFLPALGYALALETAGRGQFAHSSAAGDALLVGAGLITIGPLLLFAAAVQRVPLSVIGILQYIAPTIQFLLGVLLYREPFSRPQLVGFALVWAALAVFTGEGLLAHRQPRAVVLDEGAL